jgi:hypothetical protein
MTIEALLIVALAGLLAAAIVFSIEPVRRYRRARARARAAATREPVHLPATTPPWPVPLPLVRDARHHTAQPPAARGPATHTGADETWSPAADVAGVGSDPNLTTLAMHMAADHAALASISDALDAFDAAIEGVLDQLLRDNPRTRMRLPASVEDTGALDLRALHELLDAEDRELATAR